LPWPIPESYFRRRVPLVRILHRNGHHGPGLEVDGMPSLVREVGAVILHLRDLGF
jgi:hypothetical protein